MPTTYITEIQSEKKYQGNVVIKFAGSYFAIRKPDSGLEILRPFDRCVSSLILNPTQIDLKKVTTTIASYSFRLLDRDGVISGLVAGDGRNLLRQQVEIWLGRSGVGMDFADYYKLPITKLSKIDHSDNSYNFASSEETERMTKAVYALKTALSGAITNATTTITCRDSIDDFPASGLFKLDDEFISYTSKNNSLKRFLGCARGELGSTPASHEADATVMQAQRIIDNPLNMILRLLTSNGGGGSYDNLDSGLGISNTLIDLTEIEALRDLLFSGVQFDLTFYDIDSALKYIEEQILMPCNLRFTYSENSKLSLAILDRAIFTDEQNVIDEDSISEHPKWSLDSAKLTNSLDIEWDFDEGTKSYLKRTNQEDAASISQFGDQPVQKYSFKGVKSALAGQAFMDDFTTRFLTRLAYPTAEIQVKTHIDKSLQTIGDKTYLISKQLPAPNGSLNFASELEIVSRSINVINGDVIFKLAYTSFTTIRSCYIAPSDVVKNIASQSALNVPAGRGDAYMVGWKMRLWDIDAKAYAPDAVNEIQSISGDTITFVNAWATPLVYDKFRLKFADYDDCADSQKRYCFVSSGSNLFNDGKEPYKVTY